MSKVEIAAASATKAPQAPGFYRFKLGSFEAIALHDGVIIRDRPPGFVRNANDEDVGEAYASAGMARDKLTLTFTALAINTAKEIVLIDTGFGKGGAPGTGALVSNLAAAGIRPVDVGCVIISHFHADHISGLRSPDGSLIFPNAEVLVPEIEWNFWMDDSRMNGAPEGVKGNFELVRRVFAPIAKDVRRYMWERELLPGFRSIKASGHTPGMSAIEISSGTDAMIFVADITNNPLVFARHPEWQAIFDMDPQDAVDTRKRILDRVAADKMRVSFFHAPFPATGFIIRSGAGFEYAPALWTAS